MYLAMLVAVLLLFSSGAACADPFLTCDPYASGTPQPDSFAVKLDSGALVTVPAVVNATGGKVLMYDLGPLGITNGAHTIAVTAVSSSWGSSTASNFPFVKAAPAAPTGLRLVAVP